MTNWSQSNLLYNHAFWLKLMWLHKSGFMTMSKKINLFALDAKELQLCSEFCGEFSVF